jgi:hypothetical protein
MSENVKSEDLEAQLQKIRQAAEFHASRAKKAREDFERFVKDSAQNVYQLEEGTLGYQSFKNTMETAFTYGQASGESSESNLVFAEQLALIREMVESSRRRDAERAAHDKAQAERESAALKLQERQVVAIEKLAGAAGAKAPRRAKNLFLSK